MSRFVSISLLAALLLSGIALAEQPLLLPGKTSIYQRVLTRPGAELSEQPGAAPKTLVQTNSTRPAQTGALANRRSLVTTLHARASASAK